MPPDVAKPGRLLTLNIGSLLVAWRILVISYGAASPMYIRWQSAKLDLFAIDLAAITFPLIVAVLEVSIMWRILAALKKQKWISASGDKFAPTGQVVNRAKLIIKAALRVSASACRMDLLVMSPWAGGNQMQTTRNNRLNGRWITGVLSPWWPIWSRCGWWPYNLTLETWNVPFLPPHDCSPKDCSDSPGSSLRVIHVQQKKLSIISTKRADGFHYIESDNWIIIVFSLRTWIKKSSFDMLSWRVWARINKLFAIRKDAGPRLSWRCKWLLLFNILPMEMWLMGLSRLVYWEADEFPCL